MSNVSQDVLVSIITPTYNAEKFIENTMKSVQAQTYENWEMIIVDDCSTDNTVEIIQNFIQSDDRIKLKVLENNSGASVARNTAIQLAKGKFVAFLDSDDLWLPTKVEKQIDFMLQNDLAFSFTSYRVITEEGEQTDRVIRVPQKMGYQDLLKNTIIGCLTVMLDIEKVGKVQMPLIRTRQDFALWLSILKRGFHAYGLQDELALYRQVQGSISSNKIKAAKQNWKVYREIEKLGTFKSIWYFTNYAWNAYMKHK
jgi:teichuronic acid biosynthesis glycosyltransferase TuaG